MVKILLIMQVNDILINLSKLDFLETNNFEINNLCFKKEDFDKYLKANEEKINKYVKPFILEKTKRITKLRDQNLKNDLFETYNLKLWINEYGKLDDQQFNLMFLKKRCFSIEDLLNTYKSFKEEIFEFLDEYFEYLNYNTR